MGIWASQPIGGAVAYREHVSPSGVGYEIGCGNKAVRTNVTLADLEDIGAVMDEIFARVSFGVGRKNDEPVDHPVFDRIRAAPFAPQRQLLHLAAKQLGTVGAGNHYVDLFAGEDGQVWVGVHFGSRGFGHRTASGFLALAAGKRFDEHAPEGEMDSPPVVFAVDRELGQAYVEAMTLAGEYAYAGRDVVVDKVLDILGATATYEVHNHHNYAWREEHDGERWWVVRKGCTPAFPGQEGFVGATMGEESVILEGTPEAQAALFSTVHGAGRAMSRTQAAGKIRRRKVWECGERDCAYRAPLDRKGPGGRPIPCQTIRTSSRTSAGFASGCARARSIGHRRLRSFARVGSSCAAVPRMRRRAPTSALARCSPLRATPSAYCTGYVRSASRWPAPTPTTGSRISGGASRPSQSEGCAPP